MWCRSLDLKFKAKLKSESGNQKIQYDHQAAILKVTYLKINRLLSIHTSNVQLKFRLDIQSQTEVRVWKLKNPRQPPGGHFESNIAENQQASAHGHQQHAYEISNWNSKANLSYAPETMSPTDGRTERRRWFQYTPPPSHPPTTNFVGRRYKNQRNPKSCSRVIASTKVCGRRRRTNQYKNIKSPPLYRGDLITFPYYLLSLSIILCH